jgi:hypothetical protein
VTAGHQHKSELKLGPAALLEEAGAFKTTGEDLEANEKTSWRAPCVDDGAIYGMTTS